MILITCKYSFGELPIFLKNLFGNFQKELNQRYDGVKFTFEESKEEQFSLKFYDYKTNYLIHAYTNCTFKELLEELDLLFEREHHNCRWCRLPNWEYEWDEFMANYSN